MLRTLSLKQSTLCLIRAAGYRPLYSRSITYTAPCLRKPCSNLDIQKARTKDVLELFSPKRDIRWMQKSKERSTWYQPRIANLRIFDIVDLKTKLRKFSNNQDIIRKSKNLGIPMKLFREISVKFVTEATHGNIPRITATQLLSSFTANDDHRKLNWNLTCETKEKIANFYNCQIPLIKH